MVAGAADGLDAQPLRRQRIELAVAMARDQHLAAMMRPLDERRHEMLSMPEREDNRHLGLDDVVNIVRIIAESIGHPNQPQKACGQEAGELLKPAGAQQIAEQLSQRAGFVS